ncbi:hypothetical protein GPECTOR_39g478 [Gonium pectorale]|uniref:Nitroreductase domain-containing protein n=1 Tax=Gonium pectorale TaxID=33097 RepID=A0A150GAY8_GONPE|nr:hypothetical protein GPECTOR_39g478 [Gonium pectorale]|eukprot:KXZ46984.1 hypothetical protein GPECTOR_39g478 [Gonium pectorale]
MGRDTTDQEGLGQSAKDRQVQAMDSRFVAPGMNAELGILALLLVSGVSGMLMSSVSVTCTMFVGGLVTWLFFTLPELLRQADSPSVAAGGGDAGLLSPDAVLELIRRRRSVFPKDYNGKKVPREQLERLLEAANWAPTHGLTEPWRFVVLEGASKKEMEDLTMELCRTRLPEEKAAKTLEKLEKKRASTWGKISCYIAICCKRQSKPEKLMPEWEEMAAVSCAVQNMALLATSMGLAAYWTSWQEVARESPEMKALLGLAPEDRMMGFFTVGCIELERREGYRGSRGPWAEKVAWKS